MSKPSIFETFRMRCNDCCRIGLPTNNDDCSDCFTNTIIKHEDEGIINDKQQYFVQKNGRGRLKRALE